MENASRMTVSQTAMLQDSGWKCTRVQTTSKRVEVHRAEAFRWQFLLMGPNLVSPTMPVGPPWPQSVALILWVPVYFCFRSRLSSCHGQPPGHSPLVSCYWQGSLFPKRLGLFFFFFFPQGKNEVFIFLSPVPTSVSSRKSKVVF